MRSFVKTGYKRGVLRNSEEAVYFCGEGSGERGFLGKMGCFARRRNGRGGGCWGV